MNSVFNSIHFATDHGGVSRPGQALGNQIDFGIHLFRSSNLFSSSTGNIIRLVLFTNGWKCKSFKLSFKLNSSKRVCCILSLFFSTKVHNIFFLQSLKHWEFSIIFSNSKFQRPRRNRRASRSWRRLRRSCRCQSPTDIECPYERLRHAALRVQLRRRSANERTFMLLYRTIFLISWNY